MARTRALHDTEEQVRLLLDATAEGIYGLDLDGRCTFANAACLRMLGYRDQEELVGKRMHDLVHHTHPDGTRCTVQDCKVCGAGLSSAGATLEDEVIWRADGTSFPVEYRAVPVRRDGVRVGAVVSFVDITERRWMLKALRESEAQLRQAQKMEAIGQLAGGLAHDFNNVLLAILSSCAEMIADLGDEHRLRQDIDEIQQSAARGAALTRQLLAFSRRELLAPRAIHLNEVVRGMERLLGRVLGPHVEVAVELAPSLGKIRADPSQLEQVVLNLAVNARDAMPDGGLLTITTATVARDGTAAGSCPARWAMMRFTDTGHGMDSATRARIFEPFFTTKPRAQGTGLGLSVVYGIVQQSGGTIRVDSAPGRGASFEILLPCVVEP